jgi:hypothetical protein
VLIGPFGVLVAERALGRHQMAGDQIGQVTRKRAQLVPDLLLQFLRGDVRRQLRQRLPLLARGSVVVAGERPVAVPAVPGTRAAVGVRGAVPAARPVLVPVTAPEGPAPLRVLAPVVAPGPVVAALSVERPGGATVIALIGAPVVPLEPTVAAIIAALARIGVPEGRAWPAVALGAALPAAAGPVVVTRPTVITVAAERTRARTTLVVPLEGPSTPVLPAGTVIAA